MFRACCKVIREGGAHEALLRNCDMIVQENGVQKEAESDCTGLEVPSSFTANVWEVRPLTLSPGTWSSIHSFYTKAAYTSKKHLLYTSLHLERVSDGVLRRQRLLYFTLTRGLQMTPGAICREVSHREICWAAGCAKDP